MSKNNRASTNAWTRRRFLQGCSTAVAAMAGGSRLVSVTFAEEQPVAPQHNRDIVVVLFLRGGMDGLNLIAPVSDANYLAARAPGLRLAAEGDNKALPLNNGLGSEDFRLHPKAAALKELYDQKHLAIIHAAGLTNGTRSHFEAQDLMDRGVADIKQQSLSTGWLSRHLEATGSHGLLPGVAAGATLPNSLLGYGGAAAISSPQAFGFYGDERQLDALAKAYRGSSPVQRAGHDTLRAVDILRKRLKHNQNGDPLPYEPAKGVTYPGGDLAESFKTIASLVKAEVGLEAAAIDYGGWDTHQNQADSFPGLVEEMSNAIASFYNDLSSYHHRLNIVVMSEFGRRLKNNESTGTDHGHGNAMLVLGGNVNGGQLYGNWPGLGTEQLDDRADLAVTTDYRTVLGELLSRRMGNGKLKAAFPGFKAFTPLGVFRGEGAPVDLPVKA